MLQNIAGQDHRGVLEDWNTEQKMSSGEASAPHNSGKRKEGMALNESLRHSEVATTFEAARRIWKLEVFTGDIRQPLLSTS